jgi:hypothetical protein|tara:strand:+ start:6054 stop:6524 length:471 start_codon:yes stop_codon:yes gene_type:complete
MADIAADERTPRETDSREANEREKPWEPPQVLPDPAPQGGWVFRWIRTSIMGNQDNVNVSKRFREGWEPVRAQDHPEMMLASDRGSDYTGNIEVGGLLLCKTSEENYKARADYYADVARKQYESVNHNFMREDDPRMPKLNESSTRVTFGGGAKPL